MNPILFSLGIFKRKTKVPVMPRSRFALPRPILSSFDVAYIQGAGEKLIAHLGSVKSRCSYCQTPQQDRNSNCRNCGALL